MKKLLPGLLCYVFVANKYDSSYLQSWPTKAYFPNNSFIFINFVVAVVAVVAVVGIIVETVSDNEGTEIEEGIESHTANGRNAASHAPPLSIIKYLDATEIYWVRQGP